MTKRLTCENCGEDNHFGNLNCKNCNVELWGVKLKKFKHTNEELELAKIKTKKKKESEWTYNFHLDSQYLYNVDYITD